MKTTNSKSTTQKGDNVKPLKRVIPKDPAPKPAVKPASPSNDSVVLQQAQQIQQMQEMIDLLMKTADQGQLRREMEKDKKPIVHTIRLRQVGDKVIVSWSNRMITNKVMVHKGDIREDQTFEVTYHDGTSEIFNLQDYAWSYEMTEPLSVLETREKDGKKFYTVEWEGHRIEMEETFVN